MFCSYLSVSQFIKLGWIGPEDLFEYIYLYVLVMQNHHFLNLTWFYHSWFLRRGP